MGIGYMALWGFGAKCRSGWSGVDTPWTVTTTRAPAVLKTFCLIVSFVGLSMNANWVSELITLLTQRESTKKSNEKKPRAEK